MGQSRAADSKLLTSALRYVSHPRPPRILTGATHGNQRIARTRHRKYRPQHSTPPTQRPDPSSRKRSKADATPAPAIAAPSNIEPGPDFHPSRKCATSTQVAGCGRSKREERRAEAMPQ
jgi:hypothetical protein